jgi:hypothetical protein
MTAPLTDDHGFPAVWDTCDACGLPAVCLRQYAEASGPCEMYYANEDEHGELMEPGDPRLDGGGLMCKNCVAVLAICADREACEREQTGARS